MAIGTSKVGALGGLVPGGTETFNASGTFCVPPGVKLVSIEGVGGAGNPGNPGNPGNAGNSGNGGGGGSGGQFTCACFSAANAGDAHKNPYPGNFFFSSPPTCRWTLGGRNTPGRSTPLPGNTGQTGQSGSAGSAGSAGNPGNTGQSSSGLGYCFTGGAGGNAGSAGNAGNGGGGGPGGTGGNAVPGPSVCTRLSGNGGAGGPGGGNGGPGANNERGLTQAGCPPRYLGGGGGGGAGSVNSGSPYGPFAGQVPGPATPGTPPGAVVNVGYGASGYANQAPPVAPFANNQGIWGYGGKGSYVYKFPSCNNPPNIYNSNNANLNDGNSPALQFPSNASAVNQIPGNAPPNWARAGGGGGAGFCAVNNYRPLWNAGGGGGGGRGGAGNPGGTGGTGGAGACANPTTHNCVPVTPGSSYPITIACGGSVTISWNPQ